MRIMAQHLKNKVRDKMHEKSRAHDLNCQQKLIFINKELIKKDRVPVGLTLRFVLDIACNAHCVMCHYWDNKLRPNVSNQSYQRLIKLLDFIDPKTIAKIDISASGEPLMDKPGLMRFMQKARAQGYTVSFITNGSLLTRDYLDLLVKNGLREINISLDSHIPQVHDSIRGIKNLGSSIAVILKYAKERHPDLRINILSTIMRINVGSILGLVKMVNHLGLSSIKFSYVDKRNNNFSRLRLTDKDMGKIDL